MYMDTSFYECSQNIFQLVVVQVKHIPQAQDTTQSPVPKFPCCLSPLQNETSTTGELTRQSVLSTMTAADIKAFLRWSMREVPSSHNRSLHYGLILGQHENRHHAKHLSELSGAGSSDAGG